jgi:pentapeptide MXKDX repeat protein
MRYSVLAAVAVLATAPATLTTAQDAMQSNAMSSDSMSSDSMSSDAMMSGGMMLDDMMMANDAMKSGDAMMGDAMMAGSKAIMITIEDVTKGQPFSPSYFESRGAGAPALFKLGDKASDALVAVAEGGNIGMFSVGAAKDMGSMLGDAQLAIHTLPGQVRTIIVHVDEKHPLIDAVWMLGNTNDGFSGFTGVDAFGLTAPMTLEVKGYDAGSEKNNEKKGYLGALGGGNERDPEDGVITWHQGIRGDAAAPKDWNWDVKGPVARVTFTPLPMAGM